MQATPSGLGRRARRARRGPSATVGDELDVAQELFHDLPADVLSALLAEGEPHQSATPLTEAATFTEWPAVATRVLVGADDRLFPATFQRQVAHARLGIDAGELPGGHLLALSRPVALARRLEDHWSGRGTAGGPHARDGRRRWTT